MSATGASDQRPPLPTSTDEEALHPLVDWARANAATPEAVALLAKHLAESGEQLTWPESTATVDLASTGGPGSLSTLLVPLALCAAGLTVVKLAVPGRPAGAIDSLGTIPGYRSRLTPDEVRGAANGVRFAHFLADERFAPLDAVLFEFRRRVGALPVPLLAASSLLSKKVAVGVRRVGLDVRVGPHGNFGSTTAEARDNARLFCRGAGLLGIDATAFLTPDDRPAQPWIGRGESLVALAHALGVRPLAAADPWLDQHVDTCWEMARSIARRQFDDDGTAGGNIRSRAAEAFAQHIVAQGATVEAFLARVDDVLGSSRIDIAATESGVLAVDLAAVRDALVDAQGARVAGVFPDPAGVQLLAAPGALVKRGDPIARLRSSVLDTAGLLERLRGAFSLRATGHLGQSPPLTSQPSLEVVRA